MYRSCNMVVVSTGYTLLSAAGVVYTANTETKLCKLTCTQKVPHLGTCFTASCVIWGRYNSNKWQSRYDAVNYLTKLYLIKYLPLPVHGLRGRQPSANFFLSRFENVVRVVVLFPDQMQWFVISEQDYVCTWIRKWGPMQSVAAAVCWNSLAWVQFKLWRHWVFIELRADDSLLTFCVVPESSHSSNTESSSLMVAWSSNCSSAVSQWWLHSKLLC